MFLTILSGTAAAAVCCCWQALAASSRSVQSVVELTELDDDASDGDFCSVTSHRPVALMASGSDKLRSSLRSAAAPFLKGGVLKPLFCTRSSGAEQPGTSVVAFRQSSKIGSRILSALLVKDDNLTGLWLFGDLLVTCCDLRALIAAWPLVVVAALVVDASVSKALAALAAVAPVMGALVVEAPVVKVKVAVVEVLAVEAEVQVVEAEVLVVEAEVPVVEAEVLVVE